MKVCIAGTYSAEKLVTNDMPKYMLESYFYISEWQINIIPKIDLFLLDSGAFTFMSNNKNEIEWDKYIESYAKFINKYNIKYFFELDIDKIVGINEVERLRDKLESLTNKKCIPVWHKSRGLDYWKRLTQDYDYIAIGGFVNGEIQKKEYKYIQQLLSIAKNNNCKVHGLGFTSNKINKYKFYSVDSTTWISARKYGELSKFVGDKMIRIKRENKRIKKGKREALEFNYKQWLKFQKYADKFL